MDNFEYEQGQLYMATMELDTVSKRIVQFKPAVLTDWVWYLTIAIESNSGAYMYEPEITIRRVSPKILMELDDIWASGRVIYIKNILNCEPFDIRDLPLYINWIKSTLFDKLLKG